MIINYACFLSCFVVNILCTCMHARDKVLNVHFLYRHIIFFYDYLPMVRFIFLLTGKQINIQNLIDKFSQLLYPHVFCSNSKKYDIFVVGFNVALM